MHVSKLASGFELFGGVPHQTNAVLLFHSLPVIGEEALGSGRHFVAINHDEGWIERMLVGNAAAFSLDWRAPWKTLHVPVSASSNTPANRRKFWP